MSCLNNYFLKTKTDFRNGPPKDRMFKFTNISEALLYFGKFKNLLRPLLLAIFRFFIDVTVLSNHIEEQYIMAQ